MKIEEYHKYLRKGKPNKYGNKRTDYNGVMYDSKAEASRAQELDMLVAAKVISFLVRQPRLPYIVNGKKLFTYVADFGYFDNQKEIVVFEDVKGVETAVFKLKKKCIEEMYKITIQII